MSRPFQACGTVYLGFKVSGGSASKESPQRVAVKKVDKKNVPMNRGVTSDVMNEVRILKVKNKSNIFFLFKKNRNIFLELNFSLTTTNDPRNKKD